MDGRAQKAAKWDPEPLFLFSPFSIGDISSYLPDGAQRLLRTIRALQLTPRIDRRKLTTGIKSQAAYLSPSAVSTWSTPELPAW